MEGLDDSLGELRRSFRSGRTRSLAWRKSQLNSILDLIRDNEEKIFDALYQDLGKHPVESYRDEVGVVEKSTRNTLNNLEKWMAPKKGRIPLVFFPAKGEVVPEPLGLVLIMASWNFPISLALDPVIGAISAGNTVVLKPSELAPACSSFLAKTIPLYLDHNAINVIEGGPDVSQQLLQYKWDKIFFIGSPQIGRSVMSAAAKHLTPVTLELGGKCPIILDSLTDPRDFKMAVKRIAGGKWGACNGQACIGIDYVLVEETFAPVLIDLLKTKIRHFYGGSINNLKNISKIVNKRHYQRLCKLLEDPAVAASIVYGGLKDENTLVIEPTIILNPPLDSAIMTEEIFGPLLPIITLKHIQESIDFINSRPKPLSIYAFTQNEMFKRQIVDETSSGGVTFNDVLVQFLCDELPFGGIGESGHGRYHGKYSFDTFSHEKAVLRRTFLVELEARYPPWNDFKMRFVRLAYRFNYLGLLLMLLGLKR